VGVSVVPKLDAAPETVVIDVDAGEATGTTAIEYWKDPDQNLWWRDRPGPWRRAHLEVTGADDAALVHGSFTTEALAPGQIYEATIWSGTDDPNAPGDHKPLVAIAVFALRKAPEPGRFLQSEDWTVGGTQYHHFVTTTSPVNAYEAVGTEPPVPTPDGGQTLPSVVGDTWEPVTDSHLLQIHGLLPGTRYYVLTRLSDEHGRWEIVSKTLTTKQRQIQLRVTSIYVDDDSDDLSDGEGGMSWTLQTGHAESWKDRGAVVYKGSYGSGNWVDAPADVVSVGPETVTAESAEIRVQLYVWDMDNGSFPLPDDGDSAEATRVLLAVDPPDEDVIDREEELVAGPGSDGLKVTTKYRYSVRYF
jgi:hypothetical protein